MDERTRTPTPTALIVGGGVAGPVTAMALRRAGIDATIFEAHARGADDVGVFLTLQINGISALRAIDADRVVARLGFPTPAMRFSSGSGRYLGAVSTGGALADGTVAQTLRRSDLYRALRDEALRRGARIEYRKRLVDAVETDDGVVATFADGSQARGDLLIGADGIRSRLRTVIDPAAPPVRYLGLLNIGGFAPGVFSDAAVGEYHMIFGKRAFFGYAVAPDETTWWFANPPRRDEPTADELAALSSDRWRAGLLDAFGGDRSPAVDIIRATTHPLRGWATHDLPNVPTWRTGRMVLIGDAAHATSPSSGQGASMAIEDAVVLAKHLRDLPTVPAALAAYEASRRDRVERIVAAGARSSRTKIAGPVGRVFRDLGMRAFLRMAAGKGVGSLAWMHQYRIDWDAPVSAAAPSAAARR